MPTIIIEKHIENPIEKPHLKTSSNIVNLSVVVSTNSHYEEYYLPSYLVSNLNKNSNKLQNAVNFFFQLLVLKATTILIFVGFHFNQDQIKFDPKNLPFWTILWPPQKK